MGEREEVDNNLGTDIDAPILKTDLLGKRVMPWEEEDDITEPFYSECEVCGKHIYNHDGRMPYLTVWGTSLNSERFCKLECARAHLADTGIKKECKHCKNTFYVQEGSYSKFRRFCSIDCSDKYNSDKDSPFNL